MVFKKQSSRPIIANCHSSVAGGHHCHMSDIIPNSNTFGYSSLKSEYCGCGVEESALYKCTRKVLKYRSVVGERNGISNYPGT